jgi:polyhydroxybutyrate depolymerase
MRRFVIACSAAMILSPGDLASEPLLLGVGAQQRTYILERPSGQMPRPTIIMLHGLAGSGADAAKGSGLDRLAPQNGFVAVFPDKHPALDGWSFFPPGKEPPLLIQRAQAAGGIPDDVGFLKALVADLVRRGISDPRRVYLAGTSNGSFMALRMICSEAGMFAAVGLVVGGMPDVVGDGCRPARPVPVVMLSGTADKSVPYAGGLVQPRGLFSAWPTERLVAFFRELNGCPETGEVSSLPAAGPHQHVATRWTGCARGAVAFHRIIGGEHSTYNVDVGQLLLDFFRDKAR